MKSIQSKTVVFITGAFVSHNGWQEWQKYFESKGYKTLAPAWPHKDASAKALREMHPNNTGLADLTLTELVNHYAAIVKQLPEKPILVGHSLGGLVSQILLNRGLAEAAAVLHPVPPQGIIPYEFSFLKSAFGALGLFTSLKKTYLMPFKTWQYAFTNGMSLDDQQAAYEANTIPESKRVARGGLTSAAKVDFKKPHNPLLIISGSTDNIIPASLNYRNFKRYKQNGSVTEYKEFKGKNHFVVGLPTWREEADYILDWINRQ
ncbi:MAG: alpha/beta hydrolase [Lewinellaceae bacterium]|nr:alpha/beta hydrolase [Lewinella sp.]MCB9281267.1 alpha/beta hydrolase [Lewinellaceae bacterium]